MKDSALFIGWGGVYPGREHYARKVFTEFVEALTDLQTNGEIDSYETVMLNSGVGPLDGFVLIFGDPAKLALIPEQEVFQHLRIKARLSNANLFLVPAIAGDRVPEFMGLWEEFATQIEELVTT